MILIRRSNDRLKEIKGFSPTHRDPFRIGVFYLIQRDLRVLNEDLSIMAGERVRYLNSGYSRNDEMEVYYFERQKQVIFEILWPDNADISELTRFFDIMIDREWTW